MLAALLLILTVSIVLWYFPNHFMNEQVPYYRLPSQNGAWDVTSFDFDAGTAFLTAEVGGIEHAPGVLLTPEEFDSYTGEIIRDKGVDRSLRVVTARLRIKVPEHRTYMLMTKSNDYNERTYIGGELRREVGNPSLDPETSAYGFAYSLFEARPDENGVIEIVKQTSNYVHKETGTLGGTYIGTAPLMTRFYNMTTLFPSITAGVLLCLFVVHIILFLLLRDYWPNLWFSLFCLMWMIRGGLANARPFWLLFPGIDWELTYRLGCVSIALTGVLILMFFRAQFPGVVQKGALYALLAGQAGFIVYYLLADTNIVSRAKVGAEVLAVATGVYLVARGIMVLPKKMRRGEVYFEQWITLFGVGLVALAMLHDALYYGGFHQTIREAFGITWMFYYEIGEVAILAFVLLEMVAMFCGTLRQVTEARRDADIALETAELARKNEKLALLHAENLQKDLELREQITANIPTESLITCGPFILNTHAAQAFLGDEDLLLSPKEFAILLYLIRHEDEVVSREAIYESVWQQPLTAKDQALTSGIYRLRSKIGGSGYQIAAVRGKGYRFEKALKTA
ncbi:hypothetical protein K160097B7_33060 [[Clostridium] hylemonae]